MTLTELELRLVTLERELARLAGKVDAPAPANVNAWIDQIHGTFENDAAYRQAARLGREWRKSHRGTGQRRSRKSAGK
jgi:hypothetical protein